MVTRCTTRCHSLSLVVTLGHSLSLAVIRYHLLYHPLSPFVIRCHSLSLVVPLVVIRCHSLHHSLSLVTTRCTTRLSFYKRSKNTNHETESLNAMNFTTVLEEKIVLFTASTKIPEREKSISPSSFYGQLPDY